MEADFRVVIGEIVPLTGSFVGVGNNFVRGLFDGQHWLLLAPSTAGTLFRHSEDFSGLSVAILRSGSKIWSQAEAGFEVMNRAIKGRAEAAD